MDRKKCNICGRCCSKCPTGALTIAGKEMSPEEILEEIQKDAAFFEESEGGITVSGGEPFSQPDFLKVFLGKCKQQNIHTALDTCGYVSSKYVEKIADKVDLFLYDIKLMDGRKHRKYTGVSNRVILKNFKKLAEESRSFLVRFPVIPGINDDVDNVRQTAEFVSACGVKNVSLLPYHRAGIEKYKALGKSYKMGNTRSPSDKQLKQIKQSFENCGLRAKIGGG